MRKTTLVSLVSSLLLAAGSVDSKEGGDQYPNGAENWYAGAVPPPGNYFINYFGYYGGKLKDQDGDNLSVGGKTPEVGAIFDALRFLQVTDYKLLGANWGWHVIVPVVHQRLDIAPLGGRASETGLGDITLGPLILAWHHNPEWHTVVGFDINLPTGAYDETDPRQRIGANYYSFEPVFAVSYLGSNGWEASGKFMYNFKTRNDDTDYESGDEFHMDYLVGKHSGPWGFGVSGYFLKQTTSDKQNGSKVGPDGNKGQVFAIGPSVMYQTAGKAIFVGQWQHETNVENRFGGDKFWFKAIIPF